jgi:UDP-N-acetylmuramyl pentapeptide phosphotransferase/UDP-N-acetylglucosamine-1-phosphate transferase
VLAAVAAVLGAGLVSAAGTWALIPLLRLDQPNQRSSHSVPTPRGGGIALVGAILAAWCGLVAAGAAAAAVVIVVLGAAALALVSWLDDRGGLTPPVRLAAQFAVVAVCLAAGMPGGAVFQGWLPLPLDRIVTALAWVWFLNLYNFMDGIDGIAGGEAAAIALGLVLFAAFGAGADPQAAALAAAILAAALGFLAFNWAPARIFMGDVGSVPLGFLLGFLLLRLAAAGWWKIALILPLYFSADATITLVRRALRGAKVWQAHREHFYQHATAAGLSHQAVAIRVVIADLALVACGWTAENGAGLAGLLAAAAVVALLLFELGRRR